MEAYNAHTPPWSIFESKAGSLIAAYLKQREGTAGTEVTIVGLKARQPGLKSWPRDIKAVSLPLGFLLENVDKNCPCLAGLVWYLTFRASVGTWYGVKCSIHRRRERRGDLISPSQLANTGGRTYVHASISNHLKKNSTNSTNTL